MTETVKLQNASLFGTFSSKGYKRNIHNELISKDFSNIRNKQRIKHHNKLLKYYTRCHGGGMSLFKVGRFLLPTYRQYNSDTMCVNKTQRITREINSFTKSQLTKVFINAGIVCLNKDPLLLGYGDGSQYILIDTGKKQGELHIVDPAKNTLVVYKWSADLEKNTPEIVLASWDHIKLRNPVSPKEKPICFIYDRVNFE